MTRVAEELIEAIDRLFPARIGKDVSRAAYEPPDAGLLDALEREASPVAAARDGYLQLIDADALMALATEEDVVLRLEHRPGHYIVADRPLVRVWPGNRVTDAIVQRVNAAFVVGAQRTPKQDVEFSVDQLVEVAVRALSPGVNDPFTAITCIDRLGSALSRMAPREIPSPFRRDEHLRVRVIAPLLTFPAVTAAAFDQIRQYARSSAAVTIRLLETISLVAEFVRRPEDRAALRFHAEMIVRGADGGLPEPADRDAVGLRYQTASRALREP